MDLNELAKRFHALFSGLERGHGTYNNIDETRDDGKRQGQAVTKREPVTDELWAGHLSGVNGIGIIPIRDDSTVVFGAIDVDVYEGLDLPATATTLKGLSLPLVPCRSKSGGCHLYLFCKAPVPASKMIAKLQEIAAAVGQGRAEIFPKQSSMTHGSNDLGSWINMPYFAGDETNRYAIKPEGDACTVEEFLAYAEASKVDADFFKPQAAQKKETKEEDKGAKTLPGGPPCLQHLLNLGFPEGSRNGALAALCIYFRKSRPDWMQCVDDANRTLFSKPLPAEEVQALVKSHQRKDYAYSCSTHPLAPYCNQVVCRSRKYGVTGGTSSFPILGQMRKLLTEPPVYFLDVKDANTGDTVVLELSLDELQDQRCFQKKCMGRLDSMPIMPSAVVWQQTVDGLLHNLLKMDPPPEEAASTEGEFWELLEQFCTGRTQAHNQTEILLGKPFTDKGRTYFRTSDLLRFLHKAQFKDYKVQQVAKVLKMRKHPDDRGKPIEQQRAYVTHAFVQIEGRGVNLWSIPEFPKRVDAFALPDSLDADDKTF